MVNLMRYQRSLQTKAAEATRHKSAAAPVQQPLPTRGPLHPILRLQQTIGNRAVQHLIQAKLKVSQPGDVYEQEADRIADRVMRIPEPSVQRQMEPEEEEEEMIQRKAIASQITPLFQRQALPEIEREEDDSPGQSLDADTHAFMKSRFGHDFSQVRIHADVRAAESAQAVNALAYTVGQNVVFGRGQYTPSTLVGKQLLAHELTHVIQQTMMPSSHRAFSSVTAAEMEAQQNSQQVTTSEAIQIHSGIPNGIVQRQSDKNPLDATAKTIIAKAKDSKTKPEDRAIEAVTSIITTYYSSLKQANVDSVKFDEKRQGMVFVLKRNLLPIQKMNTVQELSMLGISF